MFITEVKGGGYNVFIYGTIVLPSLQKLEGLPTFYPNCDYKKFRRQLIIHPWVVVDFSPKSPALLQLSSYSRGVG